MKKLFGGLYLLVTSVFLSAQFIELHETATRNKFLGLDMSTCKTTTNNSKNHYQKGYDCGNVSVSELLNVNFLDSEFFGRQFYIFNDFMYWIGKNKAPEKALQQPDTYFSGAGVFMIVIGTSSYLKKIVAPQKKCPQGQYLVCGQLKYNDGSSIACWSQDAICLAPSDKFVIQISSEQDSTVKKESSVDAQGIDWMKDPAPTANYKEATTSPRKIRLVRK